MKTYDKQFIGGVWREGRGEHILEDRDPYTGEVLCRYRSAGLQDLDDAYAAARAAQKEWYAMAPARRVEALVCEAQESRARGVAVCMDQFEEAASWDFPEEKRALEAEGIRAAEFCKLPYPAEKDETLRGRMAAFVEELKGGTADG